jgi:hypothetical protein
LGANQVSSQLPEGFTLNYNIPSNPTQELMNNPQQLPEGFTLNYNIPSDNEVPVVTRVEPQEVQDPVASSEGVTVGSYIGSKLSDLTDALSEDYQESVDRSVRALEAEGITGGERVLRVAGAGFNLAADVIGETFIAGLDVVGDGVSALVPDVVEEPIKQKFKEGLEFALQSEAGQAGMNALMEGAESWQGFKEAYPRAAENIESVVDIALFVTPVKGATGIKPVKPSVLERQARKQSKIAARTATQGRRQKIVSAFQDVDADMQKRTIDGTVRLTPMEVRAADALQATKGFSVNRSASYNSNVVNKEINKLNLQTSKAVVNATGTADLPKFYSTITTGFDDLVENSVEKARVVPEVSRVMEALEDSIAKNGNTAKGLLESRRELDRWFTRVKGEDGFNKKGAIVDAVRIARNSLNDEIAKLAPETTGLLRKQSGLMYAADGLAEKAVKEGALFSRVLTNTMKAVGAQRDVGFALVALSGGALSYATAATPIALAAGIAGGAYVLGKPLLKYGISKTVSRKNLATVLSATDKAIKAAKGSPELIKQLRADRAALITFVRDLEEIWENGGEEAFKADQDARAGEPLKRDPETGEVVVEITY